MAPSFHAPGGRASGSPPKGLMHSGGDGRAGTSEFTRLRGGAGAGAHKVMGAGVSTSPHFPLARADPGIRPHFRGRKEFRASSCDLSSAPFGFPGQGIAALTGPQRVPFGILLFRRVPFRASSARRLGLRWTSSESGSGIGFRLRLTLLPPIALPVAPASFNPCGSPHARRGGNGLEPFLPFPVQQAPAHDSNLPLPSESRNANPAVDKEDIGDNFSGASAQPRRTAPRRQMNSRGR